MCVSVFDPNFEENPPPSPLPPPPRRPVRRLLHHVAQTGRRSLSHGVTL